MITLIAEKVSPPYFVRISLIRWWYKAVASLHRKKIGNIVIILCNDTYLQTLNKQFLRKDYFTDVITFDYSPTGKVILEGDIFISLERVKENAVLYHSTYEEEFHRVLIHGLLHLIGFKDKTKQEQKVMRQQEDIALEMLRQYTMKS